MQDAASTSRPLCYAKCWALTNFGNPQSIHSTRAAAIRAAEERTGRPWSQCSAFMEVRKITLIEGWK